MAISPRRNRKTITMTTIDIYSGDLNTERIKEYRKLAELYNVGESTIRNIFCAGADWALRQAEKEMDKNTTSAPILLIEKVK